MRAKPPPSNLSPPLRLALKSLSKKKVILILPSDKARATVTLDKSSYDVQICIMLSDNQTYCELHQDPAPLMERKLNALLLQLRKKGAIPTPLYNHLRSSGGQIPLVYGLPKVHKPLRPIVSFFSSPSYELSKYLSKLLSPLVGNSESFV